DVVEPQHGGDRRAHQALVLGGGCGDGAGGPGGFGQGGAVDLAVGSERELGEDDEVGGNHVLDHVGGGPGRHLLRRQFLTAADRDDVPHQVGAARAVLPGDDTAVPYARVLGE